MKLNTNIFILFATYLFLSFPSTVTTSQPICTLYLSCKNGCTNAKLVNGLDNSIQTAINLDNTHTDSNLVYIQYQALSFNCEPGDKITFTATGNFIDPQYYGAFIGYLKIEETAGSSNNEECKSDSTCFIYDSNCNLNNAVNWKLLDTTEIPVLEFTDSLEKSITIKIPYNYNANNEELISNINTNTNFVFSQFVTPKIQNSDLNRLKIKIVSFEDSTKASLYKTNNPTEVIINNGNSFGLDESITFSSLNDNFGTFHLGYHVIIMTEEPTVESTETYYIKFNACYKYCTHCNAYNEINPTNKQCTVCKPGAFFIDDTVNNIESDRCFSLSDEIQIDFTNYYFDSVSQKYKKCHESCLNCAGSDQNCGDCNILYYKIDGLSGETKQCYDLNYINTNKIDYYLLGPPNGDTFYKCDDQTNKCYTCKLAAGNCFSCMNGWFFSSIDVNKCQDTIDTNYYFQIQDTDTNINTYVKMDVSCAPINSDNKKKCNNCASNVNNRNYYKYENENFCYLEEEVNYKYGINTYLDDSTHEFKKCDESCSICSGSSNNCLKCSENYYFVEGISNPNECKKLEDIDQGKYYLPKGDDKYHKCDTINDPPICICDTKNDYCLDCGGDFILKEDEHKCYPSNTQITGYYPENKVFKKCDDSCLTCNGNSPEKCLTCAYPYYPLKLNDVYYRCLTQIEKNNNTNYNNYYLDKSNPSNLEYKNCDQSCLTCEDGTNGLKCIKCNTGFAFYEDGQQSCVLIENFFNSGANQNYYFNTYLQEFRKCHKSCKTCENGVRNDKCFECDTDNTYVFIDDPQNGKCVPESLFSELKNYYFKIVDHFNKENSPITVKVYKKCHENCNECNEFDLNSLQCKICNNDKGYYKTLDDGRNTPFNDNLQQKCTNNILVDHYFLDGNKYSPSLSQCLKGTYETQVKESCVKCHNKFGYFSLEHAPETCQNTIPEDHYITSNNIIKICPYECASCSEGPTSTSTNCDVCKEEFPPSLSNPKNCIFKCDFYQYKYYDVKYCTGEKECPDLVPYLIKENSTCVQKCEKVSYYGVCYNSCPSKTYWNGNECKDNPNTCVLSNMGEIREYLVDLKNDITPVTKKVKKYRKYFSGTVNHVDIYTHYSNEYTMIIYQKNSCVKELLPDYISIDFPSSCSYTQGNYIIVLFLVHRENKYDQFYYKLYPISDLDHPIDQITYCYNVKVEIPHKQANFDIDKYQEYYKKQIYLDNYMENFFYDMCFLNYEDGKDIVMNKRRKEYFQDPYKICIDNCEFNVPPDFTYKRAICNCQNSYPSHSLNNLYEDYYDNNINYVMGEEFYDADVWVLEHLKCLKYIGEDNNIFKNMGSYLIIFFFLFEVVTMIVFGVVGIDSIKMFIIDFIIGNPPKKGRNNNGSEKSSNNNNIKSDISNKDVSSNLMEEKRGNKSVKKKIFNNNFTIKQLDSDNEKIKSWESPDLLVGRSNNLRGYIKNKEIEIYQQKEKNKYEENNDINEKEINTSDKNSNLFSEKKYQLDNDNNSKNIISEKYNHKFTDFELNSMELYDAIKKDKRTFCYFYKLQMLEKQEFYRTFCKYEPIFPISIKIIKYIFNLSLNLVFNALLYTEDQIYEGTKSIGKNIGYIFLRSFYTFLIVKGIDYIINLLVKNSNYLRSLVYRKKREKELRIDSYKSLKRIKACFIFFFVFVIVCDILFWIFLSSYCYCYNGEQAELFGAFLVTQFYIEIYCIVFALYLTVLRFIGLKCRATTCYKLSQTFLDT